MIQNFTTGAVLQSAATTGNGATFSDPQADNITIYIRSNGTVSAGGVTIEEDSDGTAATWAAIGSEIVVTGTNSTKAVHLATGCYGVIRARISTAVTGGTVTVTLVASY